ncbi:type I restriction enzyme M protein [Clostridium pascui]|uniref:HsdM family class I SAM-dependent methyltransferase n=1 Tax=Clostridium pascui TaxID=46609 RepID=UPI00311CB5BE|nr:type I restriction enzyme M protein [Clostridium pascui]
MTTIFEVENKIKQMIDELKGLCTTNGLGNQASEEKVITSIFLYKFLNDKFMYNLQQFAEDLEMTIDEVLKNENDELDAFYSIHSKDVAFEYEDTITKLLEKVSSETFYQEFDNALIRISNSVKNEIFAVETADRTKKPLFESITEVVESSARNNFAKAIFSIISKEKFDFSGAFAHNFDFYSAIFEYLIKDYNVASGVYAEYFTPQAVSKIIAKILVGSTESVQAAEIYDPSAGSGSLVLHLAHELGDDDGINRALVYTQDISQKSSRFLRINMLLNGLTESLQNLVQGDTLLNPSHYNREHDATSGLKKFDYITSNPPFKMDFSTTRDQIENKWGDFVDTDGNKRFFAGIPTIPAKKKESMAIYLLFLQHIIFSLKENGKAAIVVPTGFITAQSGIEKKIRQKLIDEKMLKGVVSMPSNIFANTGTNVSILFLDKANKDGGIVLMDASKLGAKVKDGKNQRTSLSHDEEQKIIDTFIKKEVVEDFSVVVSYEDIQSKNYSFSAGQYFDVKIEYVEITQEEFENKVSEIKDNLRKYFAESNLLEEEILNGLEELKYE